MVCGETWAMLVAYGRILFTIPLVLIYLLLTSALIVDKKCADYIGKFPFLLILLIYIVSNIIDIAGAFLDLLLYTPTSSSLQFYRMFPDMAIPYFVLLVILDKLFTIIGVGFATIYHIVFTILVVAGVAAEYMFLKSRYNDWTMLVTFLLIVASVLVLVAYHVIQHHKNEPQSIVAAENGDETPPPCRKRYFNAFSWSLIVQVSLFTIFKVFFDVANFYDVATCNQDGRYAVLYGINFAIQWLIQMFTALYLLTSQKTLSVKMKKSFRIMSRKRDAKIANVMGVENTGMPEGGITNFGSHMRKF